MRCRHWFFQRDSTGIKFSLCLAAATHSFLLFSFFPYAGYMAMKLLEKDKDVTVDTIGVYAGMLGTTFTLGRFLGFLPWMWVRQRLGGKRSLVLSLLLTGIVSVWVGLASTFANALWARFFQGLSNCISGCVKRAAINARRKQKSERATSTSSISSNKSTSSRFEQLGDADPQALVLSVMWWGTALGPIVGGLLSDPRFVEILVGTPNWYESHPFLISNLCSAILCWSSMVCASLFIRGEDSPPLNGEKHDPRRMGEHQPLLLTPIVETHTKPATAAPSLWLNFCTLWKDNQAAKHHLVAYWSFSFVVVCLDEALPLFLITSKESTGLGLSEGQVGGLLSLAGLFVATGHHVALERLFDGSKHGTYRILSAGAILGNVPAVFVPVALVLNRFENESQESLLGLSKISFLFLVVLLAFLRGWMGLYFSFIGIATGQTLRVVQKDEAARIMTLGALLVRSVAPMVAGGVLSWCMSESYFGIAETAKRDRSWMIWILIGLVFGMIAAAMTFGLARHSGEGAVTEKRRVYLKSRMNEMASTKGDWDGHCEASTSNWIQWIRLVFSGSRKRKAKPEVTTASANDKNEEQNSHQPRRITWTDHIVGPGVDFDAITFFILGTSKNDKSCIPHVLTPPLMKALQKHLPHHCTESNFWLKYSLLRDGATMHTIEAKAGLARYSILAIETLNGDVFGCYMDKPWVPSNNHYRYAGESFLWRMTKRRLAQEETEDTPESVATINDRLIEVYPRTGVNEFCQFFGDHKIACGGGIVNDTGDGFGIVLAEDLLSGSSSPCQTYGNPSLVSGDNHHFEVANIEIWSLTPYMFVSDAEKSEKSLQFIKDNSYQTPSSTSPWSVFL